MRIENTVYMMSHISPKSVRDLTAINISIIFSNIVILLMNSFFRFNDKIQDLDANVTPLNREMDSLKAEFDRIQKSHRERENRLEQMGLDMDRFRTDLDSLRARFHAFMPCTIIDASD